MSAFVPSTCGSFTLTSERRSSISAAVTVPSGMATTASAAALMQEKYIIADALNGATGSVFIRTRRMNARVPSEPTSRWAAISKGSEYVMSGRRFRPVTFLMAYLCLMSEQSDGFASTLSRSASMLLMNSGWD